MRLHDRHNQSLDDRQDPPPGESPGGNLDRMRQAGQELFQAADDAINRALAGDSLAFLHATRQEGGQ